MKTINLEAEGMEPRSLEEERIWHLAVIYCSTLLFVTLYTGIEARFRCKHTFIHTSATANTK